MGLRQFIRGSEIAPLASRHWVCKPDNISLGSILESMEKKQTLENGSVICNPDIPTVKWEVGKGKSPGSSQAS